MPIKKGYVREQGKSRGSPNQTKTTGFGKSDRTNKVKKTGGLVMEDVAVAVDNQQVLVGEVSESVFRHDSERVESKDLGLSDITVSEANPVSEEVIRMARKFWVLELSAE